MYCNNHMLCLGDCPKTFKSLTYNTPLKYNQLLIRGISSFADSPTLENFQHHLLSVIELGKI